MALTHPEPPAPGRYRGPFRACPCADLAFKNAGAADKSLSHRLLILGALAAGTTEVGVLESDDVLATLNALRAFGVAIEPIVDKPGGYRIISDGVWRSPDGPLDLGNSGTGVRLLMGAAARFDLEAVFIGDESLSRRPMGRVLEPLRRMGARAEAAPGDRLPVRLHGRADLKPIAYAPPHASAQVKSAILLAGLGAQGTTVLEEARPSRDHTERLLAYLGVELQIEPMGGGERIALTGPQAVKPGNVIVPEHGEQKRWLQALGDPSSAAFPVTAALLCPGSQYVADGCLMNARRIGYLETLREMGADISMGLDPSQEYGEPAGPLSAGSSALRAVDLPPERAPSTIDEYPILAVACAFAEGRSRLGGLSELRVKESDRLAATAAMLTANGVACAIEGDDLIIEGCGPGGVPGGGRVIAHGDHRIAMAALVMGLAAKAPVAVDDVAMIATSFPGFIDQMRNAGARLEPLKP